MSARLQELEANGVVSRTVYPTVPPPTEYALTDLGKKLELVIRAMQEFGEHLPGAGAGGSAAPIA